MALGLETVKRVPQQSNPIRNPVAFTTEFNRSLIAMVTSQVFYVALGFYNTWSITREFLVSELTARLCLAKVPNIHHICLEPLCLLQGLPSHFQ